MESTTGTVFDDAARLGVDTEAGHHSLIVVDTGTDEADVNQHHPMVAGRIGEHVADGADGSRIHVGDLIRSRRHTSEIRASDHRRI